MLELNWQPTRLLQAIQEAQTLGLKDYKVTIAAIRNEHIEAARTIIRDAKIIHHLAEEIDTEILQILGTLNYAQQAHSFSEQTKDFVVSRGEKLSCMFMTALLQSLDVKTVCIDLTDILPSLSSDETSGAQLGKSLYEAITRELARRIARDCKRGIPIITGFFGGVPSGLLKTMGRGYSDLCAALVAVALEAQELQIWKEVDGVFNADPRKVPAAALLESISPSEAAELSFYGAEVIHPATMEHVMRSNIPIRVKNVMKPLNPGTIIEPTITKDKGRRSIRLNDHSAVAPRKRLTKPVAVSIKQNILVLNIQTSDRSCSSSSYLARIFSIVEQHNLKIDLISSSEMNVSLALPVSEQCASSHHGDVSSNRDGKYAVQNPDLLSALKALEEFGSIDILPHMAIISLIGDGLKQMVGISAEFFGVLAEHNINIEMISQGLYSSLSHMGCEVLS